MDKTAIAKIPIAQVPVARCLVWLRRGWRDMSQTPALSGLHGVAVAGFGALIFGLAGNHFWLLAGALSGFLLVAPVLATGLYALSRARSRGEPVNGMTITRVWLGGDGRQMRFGFLLALAGTGWVLTSASMITLWAPQPINAPMDFVQYVVLADSWLFQAWVVMGGLLAAPIFASSAIAMPMLLDRPVSLLGAVLTSWRVVITNPLPMAMWASLIMLLTAVGMAAAFLGLVVMIPLLGHASWHAYAELVGEAESP